MTSSFHQGVLASSGKPSVFHHHPQRTTEFTTFELYHVLMTIVNKKESFSGGRDASYLYKSSNGNCSSVGLKDVIITSSLLSVEATIRCTCAPSSDAKIR